MNTKRYIYWTGFVVVIILIIWGLMVAMSRDASTLGQPKNPSPVSLQDHSFGSANAPVTIIEYSDFQCPACQAYYYVVEKILASSTVPIRLVYRHFPLSQHLNSIPAALASESANEQGKFWEMYKLLFENHSQWEESKEPDKLFEEYAQKIGLDLVKFRLDLASTTLKDKIQASSDEGMKIGINATPSFFINGKFIQNPRGYEEFKTNIEQQASSNTK
jgi:protein-disulfide isomerase